MTFDEVNGCAVAAAFDSLIKFHSSAYGLMVKKTASAVSLLAINQNTSQCTTIIIGQLERDNLTLSRVALCNGELYQLEMPALYAHVSLVLSLITRNGPVWHGPLIVLPEVLASLTDGVD
ncbi:hypothetical protein PENFLA_c004G10955 [Penicillium flavigenum]|uniref:Uncharacterized protein n=1 Tax=Penicillium flavigenum TaxID=254877 RepID=A0A1V6TSX7_9EURO|nr:hypothetical protein PENFLA_c004G10955 [Penicillium flavigenum]